MVAVVAVPQPEASLSNTSSGVPRRVIPWLIFVPFAFSMMMYWKFHQQLLSSGGDEVPDDVWVPLQTARISTAAGEESSDSLQRTTKLQQKEEELTDGASAPKQHNETAAAATTTAAAAATTASQLSQLKEQVAPTKRAAPSLLEQTLRDLPDTSSPPLQGGIILFQHIVKTGGTTIRNNFKNTTRFPNVEYREVFAHSRFKPLQNYLQKRFDETNEEVPMFINKTIFVELHGRNTPTLLELVPHLQRWKQQAQRHNIPFKTFTLLRNPVDLTISFFNHFHVFGDKRFGDAMPGTLENFKRYGLQYHNPQCLYLFRGERAYVRERFLYNVTQQDCYQIQQLLATNMDWIGDTQNLSNDTLPLLTYWITGQARTATTLENSNVAHERQQQKRQPLSKKSIDADTIALIRSNSILDQSLYENSVSPPDKLKEFSAAFG